MRIPGWVDEVPQGNKPLSPRDYYTCFGDALRRMSQLLYGSDKRFELHAIERDEKISNDDAAREHFYSGFKLAMRRGKMHIVYDLSQAFFAYSYRGLEAPPSRLKCTGESDTDFIRDCATNYLVKNFWHNYVHDRAQGITDSNYHLFRHEARYYSDFEADLYANLLLPLSYGCLIAADQSNLRDPRSDILNLFARNRCNRVFADRELARGNSPRPGTTYDGLQDWEWLIRRRLANQLAQQLIANNRAVSSITMHFFGALKARTGKFTRPKAGASIELNGVRFTFENLGNVGTLTDDELRADTRTYVSKADADYSTRLRNDPGLRKYAVDSLRAKCEFLVGRPVHHLIRSVAEFADQSRRKKRARKVAKHR